jgi:transposase-like protein
MSEPVAAQVPVTMDTKGRVRTSKEQRRTLLAEFERSGLSAAGFAKRTGLKYSTLAGWLQRYRRSKLPGRAQPLHLLEAVVATGPAADQSSSQVVRVSLSGGAWLEVADEKQAVLAAMVVRALAKPC